MKSPLVPLNKLYCLTIFLIFSLPADMEAALQCKTTDREKCVFPFKFKPYPWEPARTYNECTWDWAFFSNWRNGNAWCGTRDQALLLSDWDSDTWGDCGEGCTIPGEETIFHD